ncbi:L,D-transpeptidase family protein [Actinacidiphila sp. bgisy167]|uniref:L,D-transpeptidase family protein n=1 Tax=Actinacidiphila sp. bgisy167 TaxID=3413797 RepID=UPI003D7430BF
MNSNGRHLRAALIAGAAAAALTLNLAPALAAQEHGTAPSAATAVTATTATALVYDKNQKNPADSRLSVYQGTRLMARYRAGSGTGSKDDCALTRGWIPNGNWRIKLKSRAYNGRLIKGYAVYLEDMRCSKGTAKRTEMFIHSEMNRDGSPGGRENRRWDGVGDYASWGCVKLRPADIKEMFRLLDRIGWPTHLRVVS